MNKLTVIFSIFFILMLSTVNASFMALTQNVFHINSVLHEEAKDGDANAQFYVFSNEIWKNYYNGNFSKTTALFLTQHTPIISSVFMGVQGFKTYPNTQEQLKSLTLEELTTLNNIQTKTGYEIYNVSDVDEAIKEARDEQENLYNEYLEYYAVKDLYKDNIYLMWIQIISLMQLVMEMLNIFMYLIGLYLVVYVIIEMIPDSLIYMRNKILESAIKRRGRI